VAGCVAVNKVKIIIDNRERNMDLLNRLAELGAELTFLQLPVGDYIVSDRICVERKSMHDFGGSIINSRLFDQIDRLSRSFAKPILIIEGNASEFMLNEQVMNGAIASIYVKYNVQVLRSAGSEDTAELLFKIAEHEQKEEKREPVLVGVKRAFTLSEWQELVLSSLPGVGRKLAIAMLEHFGSVHDVANASVDELMQVDKIGKKKAELIHKVLNDTFAEGK